MTAILRLLAILAVIATGECAPTVKRDDLPVVNLGYQQHQAISLDVIFSSQRSPFITLKAGH
jgi:hypothetical protein